MKASDWIKFIVKSPSVGADIIILRDDGTVIRHKNYLSDNIHYTHWQPFVAPQEEWEEAFINWRDKEGGNRVYANNLPLLFKAGWDAAKGKP